MTVDFVLPISFIIKENFFFSISFLKCVTLSRSAKQNLKGKIIATIEKNNAFFSKTSPFDYFFKSIFETISMIGCA